MCKSIILILFLFITLSCTKSNESTQNIAFEEIDDLLVFDLDQFSRANNKMYGFSEESNSFYFFNEMNRTLYFYNLVSTENTNKIKIEVEGPNGIRDISKIFVQSLDSIFIMSFGGASTNAKDIYLINKDGIIVNSFDMFDISKGDPLPQNLPNHSNDLVFAKSKIYLPTALGARTTDEKKRSLLQYDIGTTSKHFHHPLSPLFYEYKWGLKYTEAYGVLNPQKQQYVVSYPFDPNLYVLDITTNEISIVDGRSQRIENSPVTTQSSPLYYFLSNSWYDKMIYDKYRNIYLRQGIVGSRFGENDAPPIGNNATNYPSLNGDDVKFFVMVFDEEFNLLGEIPHMNLLNTHFITQKGYYFANFDYEIETKNVEDILVFERVEFEIPTTDSIQ